MEGRCPQKVTSWRGRVAAIQAAKRHLGGYIPFCAFHRAHGLEVRSRPGRMAAELRLRPRARTTPPRA